MGSVARVELAGLEGLFDVGLGGPGEHRHAAARLLADDADDQLALFGRETGELARRAVGIESVHALVDQPGYEAAEFAFVDAAVRVERDECGGEDPLEFFSHYRRPSCSRAYQRLRFRFSISTPSCCSRSRPVIRCRG